jgi:hypothetical protein
VPDEGAGGERCQHNSKWLGVARGRPISRAGRGRTEGSARLRCYVGASTATVYVAQSVVTVGDRGVAVADILIARFDGDVDQLRQAYDRAHALIMSRGGATGVGELRHHCAIGEGALYLIGVWESEERFRSPWTSEEFEDVLTSVGFPSRKPYRQHAMRTCWLLAVSSNTLSGHVQLAA